jgi:argininosuccinate lyase
MRTIIPPEVAGAYAYELSQARWLWHPLTQADLAHVLELRDIGAISPHTASEILTGLLWLDRQPMTELRLNPQAGDVYTNRERLLSSTLHEVAGWIPLGRTRREALRIALRLALRTLILEVLDASLGAQSALIRLARHHLNTVMPDYTYLQIAEPTTFGHYLSGAIEALGRSAQRLQRCYEAVDASPAGVGAVGGSTLPLDRARLAHRLGFRTVIEHTRDAMWQTDVLVELAAAIAIAAEDMSRIAEDWEIWASDEFSYVRLDANHSRASVLMPQKSNPYPLIFLRGAASLLLGRLAGIGALCRTPTAQTDNYLFATRELPESLELLRDSFLLLAGVALTLQVNSRRMRDRASSPTGFATSLAEFLSHGLGIDFKTAHDAVSASVNHSGGNPDNTLSMLRKWAREMHGSDLSISEADRAHLYDPDQLVGSRRGLGGTSPEVTARMLQRQSSGIRRLRAYIRRARLRAETASTQLVDDAEDAVSQPETDRPSAGDSR